MWVPERVGVDDFEYRTAEDLLQALNPLSAPWGDHPPAWIHRGQADANWALSAPAVRGGATVFRPFGIDKDAGNWSERKEVQDLMLDRFKRDLESSGIIVPAESPEPLSRVKPSSNAYPEPGVFPLLALARHHGLPTILLDWSRRALVAAYFAASSAVMLEPRPEFLAVWSLRIGHPSGAEASLLMWKGGDVRFYEAPGGTNPNQRAQSGLYTTVWGTDDPSLEVALERRRSANLGAPPLRRALLPTVEASKLLRLLSYEGVTGAAMFPGVDGVVLGMRERASWDRLPGP